MLIHNAHLGYCTNIHPGDEWDEHFKHLRHNLPLVKNRVSPHDHFGAGLRLSAAAAITLERKSEFDRFASFLSDHGLYVFTLNGFPFGRFGGQRVKENVYRPDWRSAQRLEYTRNLGRLLARLFYHCPAGNRPVCGSISTVALGFRRDFTCPEDYEAAANNLVQSVIDFRKIKEETGFTLVLSLEPEPECAIETTAEFINFMNTYVFHEKYRRKIEKESGPTGENWQKTIREHLGICLDGCHMAVMFEDPRESIRELRSAGIRIGKIQVSAGLQADFMRDYGGQREALNDFVDPVYLHQVVEDRNGVIRRYLDLPEALEAIKNETTANPEDQRRWRIHYHLPLFYGDGFFKKNGQRVDGLQTTAPYTSQLLALHKEEPLTDHFEVETYTFHTLPAELRNMPVDEAISKELFWTIREMSQ